MSEDTKLCTYTYKPKRCHRGEKRLAIDDWESFFYSMCDLCDVPLKWFSEEYDDSDERKLDRKYGKAKEDVKNIVVSVVFFNCDR